MTSDNNSRSDLLFNKLGVLCFRRFVLKSSRVPFPVVDVSESPGFRLVLLIEEQLCLYLSPVTLNFIL